MISTVNMTSEKKQLVEDNWMKRKIKLKKIFFYANISDEQRIRIGKLISNVNDLTAFYCYGICLGKNNFMKNKSPTE